MLVIPQSEMDEILDRKTRRRTLTLPVRRESLRVNTTHPRTGQTLTSPDAAGGSAFHRCPARMGGNYQIRGDGIDRTYERLRGEAAAQPNRARALTWLLARAEDETRELRITVHTVTQRTNCWHVGFYLDSQKTIQAQIDDAPVFLRRGSGYTVTHDEIDAGAVMGPLAGDLEEARRKAREGRVAPQREAVSKALRELATCRAAMADMKNQVRIRKALKELRAVERDLSVRARDTLAVSECATRRPSQDRGQPRGTDSEVSLRSAA